MKKLNNILGAFADGAILFPLMALLTTKAGFSSPMVLITTGVAYIAAAIIFKVPMSVQPLKSIAVAAVTVGATFSEVRISGLLLGLFCLGILFFKLDRYSKKVPTSVIHQLQLGLGILLVFQGLKSSFGLLVVVGTLMMAIFPIVAGIPLLGLLAAIGLLMAVFSVQSLTIVPASIFTFDFKMRIGMVLSLLLPQLALTMTNSVLATKDVSERTFGEEANRVTIRNLVGSIGIGNIVVAIFGGMPFCHGSGGITAHVRGGSTKAWSTGLMGVVLIALALIQILKGSMVLNFPAPLIAILLITTGYFHVQLAKPTLITTHGRTKLIVAALLTLFSRNLLVVLLGAILMEFYFYYQDQEELSDDSIS